MATLNDHPKFGKGDDFPVTAVTTMDGTTELGQHLTVSMRPQVWGATWLMTIGSSESIAGVINKLINKLVLNGDGSNKIVLLIVTIDQESWVMRDERAYGITANYIDSSRKMEVKNKLVNSAHYGVQ